MKFLQDLELEDGQIYNFIALPADYYGNRFYVGNVVIQARVETRDGKPGTQGSVARLHILQPKEVAQKWPTILERSLSGSFFVRTDPNVPAGDISNELYIKLLTEFVETKAPEANWMIEAVTR
jgi:hypothetical protein